MGRRDDPVGVAWYRTFNRVRRCHDPPWHGQRYLDRRAERHHLDAQAVLLGTVHLPDNHCFDEDLYCSSLPVSTSLSHDEPRHYRLLLCVLDASFPRPSPSDSFTPAGAS